MILAQTQHGSQIRHNTFMSILHGWGFTHLWIPVFRDSPPIRFGYCIFQLLPRFKGKSHFAFAVRSISKTEYFMCGSKNVISHLQPTASCICSCLRSYDAFLLRDARDIQPVSGARSEFLAARFDFVGQDIHQPCTVCVASLPSPDRGDLECS